MRERVVRFGPDRSLVGILTDPDPGQECADRPAVLILNTGMLHRSGPFRMHVDLARQLAGRGFTVLRFDLSGLGDSLPREGNMTGSDAVVTDIGDAVTFLGAKRGASRFVLVGLCTGAANAHAFAARDERVCGVVFIDGYAYRTFCFYFHRALPFLLNWGHLFRFVGWRISSRRARARRRVSAGAEVEDEALGWRLPPKKATERVLALLADRGVRMLFIFSGDSGTRKRFNYAGQFEDMYRGIDFAGLAESEFIREGDHIFSQVGARNRLIARICDWHAMHFLP